MSVPTWRWGEPLEPLEAVLARGGVLAIPTESSYGLAVDPRDQRGVDAVYRIKRRRKGLPLPVLIAGIGQLRMLGIERRSPAVAWAVGSWPGALTVVLPLAEPMPASAGQATLAVRVPAHKQLQQLIADLGHPVTATSANLSGSPSIVDPADLATICEGEDVMIVDGGVLPGGPPSTLVHCGPKGLRIIRAGAVEPPPWTPEDEA
ncbi:MAG: L-threonylcarbamoyladenylate synthase [Acidobacteriota bacterium]